MVKIPVFGFHLWLPKAHVEAPSLGSIILAGLLLKLGAWGIFRVLPLHLSLLSFFEVLSLRGIISAAASAGLQSDRKALVAYSSVCHLNFILYVFFSYSTFSLSWSCLIMVAHGVTASLIF